MTTVHHPDGAGAVFHEARVGTDNLPEVARVLANMRARPAYGRAIDKGGPCELINTRN
ncbi:MAG: hypothetical protein ACE5F8_06185 [Woeseiaceae bacterium]